MPRQRGVIKIEGTIDDLTFFKSKDGYMVKGKTAISKERIASDSAFQRTRENASEFGKAGKGGKLIRNAFRNLIQDAKDHRITSRLTKEMVKVIKADATNTRGMRNVIDGEAELLEGFDFNSNASLSNTLYVPYNSTINRVTGALTIALDAFIASSDIAAPTGTTHFKLVSAGAEIDFENETFTTDTNATAILPLNDDSVAAITLAHTVTANSTHPLFLVLGIQFYQQVNGADYPLKNGAFNALKMVKVEGV